VPDLYQGKFCILFSSLRDQMKSRYQTVVISKTVNVKKCTAMVQGGKMSLSLVQSRALVGLQAPAVTVEVHLANGLPSFTLVGLADVEVKEARERVRSALQNAGLEFPHNKRITVNLAPADLPKDSGRFDLPIAMGILAASGQVDAAQLAGFELAGELSLSGELRPVRGALAMSLALRQLQVSTKLVLPPGSAEEAALVPDAHIYRARHLLDVVQQFLPASTASSEPAPPSGFDLLRGVRRVLAPLLFHAGGFLRC
jgi:magnesium chelatase family protein